MGASIIIHAAACGWWWEAMAIDRGRLTLAEQMLEFVAEVEEVVGVGVGVGVGSEELVDHGREVGQ